MVILPFIFYIYLYLLQIIETIGGNFQVLENITGPLFSVLFYHSPILNQGELCKCFVNSVLRHSEADKSGRLPGAGLRGPPGYCHSRFRQLPAGQGDQSQVDRPGPALGENRQESGGSDAEPDQRRSGTPNVWIGIPRHCERIDNQFYIRLQISVKRPRFSDFYRKAGPL